mmetsp:Transcript_7961/g.17821  ORF Transcript_7961/g.17821 Transcript_7961/m.17821 type:complete len:215 (-) Transcript_7961:30-674(-)
MSLNTISALSIASSNSCASALPSSSNRSTIRSFSPSSSSLASFFFRLFSGLVTMLLQISAMRLCSCCTCWGVFTVSVMTTGALGALSFFTCSFSPPPSPPSPPSPSTASPPGFFLFLLSGKDFFRVGAGSSSSSSSTLSLCVSGLVILNTFPLRFTGSASFWEMECSQPGVKECLGTSSTFTSLERPLVTPAAAFGIFTHADLESADNAMRNGC